MAKIVNGKLIRTCRVCECTSDATEFLVQKDSKSGRMYTHNICMPCRIQYNYEHKYKNISRREHSKRAAKWNKDNRERYNKNRRVKNKFFKNCIDNFYMMEKI